MTNLKTVLFDTNVLLYVQDMDSALYGAAQQAHRKVLSKEWRGCIALQNIVEFLSVITNSKQVVKPLSRALALRQIRQYLSSDCFRVITPNQQTSQRLLSLQSHWSTRKSNHIFDLQLAATTLSNGLSTILTANVDDFSEIKGLEVIDLAKVSNVS